MESEIIYMLTIIGVVFAVNYALRALPFLLIIGRDRALPPWVERFGKLISPVIIAGLVVYSYVGLGWRSPWPFIAGIVTIVLQAWKRNPLASIIAGTVVYMCLINCGCSTTRTIELDAKNPALEVKTDGIYFEKERVEIKNVPGMLEDAGIPKDQTIHILVDGNVLKDLSEARTLMGYLAMEGYTRPVLVTKRHADSWVREKR